MYQPILLIHSWFRWIILILMVVVIIKSILGMVNKDSYSKLDGILSLSMVNSLRVQFVIGLVLYIFLSPITESAFADFGAAMKDASIRYFAVEHIFVMFVGIGLVEAGAAKAKRATEEAKKYKFQMIFFALSLIIMLSRIPFS